MQTGMNPPVFRLGSALASVGLFALLLPALGAQARTATAGQYPRVAVPNVVGLTTAQAKKELANVGLVVGKITESVHQGTSGRVYDQNPPANKLVRAGTTVDLYVVKNVLVPVAPLIAEHVTRGPVPDLSGQTREQAAATLEKSHFRLGKVGTGSGHGLSGRVFAQDPPAKKIALFGTAVNITLVTAQHVVVPQYTRVPPLAQMDPAHARTLLSERHLSLGNVKEEVSDRAAPGLIVDQSPPAETRVVVDSLVNVTIARAPLRVPPLAGYTVPQAEGALKEKGLRLGTVREALPQKPQAAGTVFHQDPPAGSPVRRGQTVNVWIAQRLVSVPDLADLDLPAARAKLGQSQLQVGTITEQAETGRAGRVVSQGLPPKTMVAPETRVDLVLSRAIPYAASVDASSTSPSAGELVTFHAHVSPAIPGAEYQFSFGDGRKRAWKSDPQAGHAYHKAGNFRLVVATRAPGATVPNAFLSVQVRPQKVAVFLSTDHNRAYTNGVVRLTATLRPPNRRAEYQFDFGDQQLSAWRTSPVAEHRYASAGSFQALVLVRIPGSEPIESAAVPLEIAAFPWIPIVAGVLIAFAAAGLWLYGKGAKPHRLPPWLSVVQTWDLGNQQITTSGNLLEGPSLRIRAAPSIGEQWVEPGKPATARGDSSHD